MQERSLKIPIKYLIVQNKKVVSPTEFYRIQLGFIAPHINNTMLTILAYVKHYGYADAMTKLYEDRVLTSMGSIKNYLTDLRKAGLLIGYEPDVRLNDDILIFEQDLVYMLILDKDETKNETKHRYYKESSL